MSEIKRPRWKEVKYSRNEVNKAGDIVRKDNPTQEEMDFALQVIDNWRVAHAYPLHVFYMYLRRMAASRSDVLVVERLKRLDSIVEKLKRESKMQLWRMQDLGGCRLIAPSVGEALLYAKKYMGSRVRHAYIGEKDYISDPKRSGYRSFHLIYKYHSEKKETYNHNMRIEMQFRSHLQHVWATALETMGVFTKQALKAGEGDTDVKRFFALVSSLIAKQEGYPMVPGTPEDVEEIISEIEIINDRHRIIDKLRAIRVAIDHSSEKFGKKGYYLLILRYLVRRLSITYFQPSQIEEANTLYTKIESEYKSENIDAVLIHAESFSDLRAAYPNYFADLGEFIQLVENYLR